MDARLLRAVTVGRKDNWWGTTLVEAELTLAASVRVTTENAGCPEIMAQAEREAVVVLVRALYGELSRKLDIAGRVAVQCADTPTNALALDEMFKELRAYITVSDEELAALRAFTNTGEMT